MTNDQKLLIELELSPSLKLAHDLNNKNERKSRTKQFFSIFVMNTI